MTSRFSWDVETANITVDSGAVVPVYAGGGARSTNFAKSPTHSMIATPTSGDDVPSGVDAADTDPLLVSSGAAVLNGASTYYRFWMMLRTGFSFGSGSKQKVKLSRTCIANGSAPGGGLVYTGYMSSDGFDLSEGYWAGTDSPIISGGDHFAAVSVPGGMATYIDNTWHEYIIRVKPNTTATSYNGQFQLYIDGVSIGSYNSYLLVSNLPNDSAVPNWVTLYGTSDFRDLWAGWAVCPYWQMNGVGAGGTAYFDNFDISDTFNTQTGGDITNPVCTIVTPTSSPTYTTVPGLTAFAGTASDDVAVSSVTWVNSGNGTSGTATGTTSWSFNATLVPGLNIVAVTATDSSGNTGTDTITITCVTQVANVRMTLSLP